MDNRPNAVRFAGALVTLFLVGACTERGSSPVAPGDQSASFESAVAQQEVLDHAVIHRTVEGQRRARAVGQASTASDLFYHGGVGGIGVETAPRVYVVFWGSQWNNNDPSGGATIVLNFRGGVGGSNWLNIVNRYCQGVAAHNF